MFLCVPMFVLDGTLRNIFRTSSDIFGYYWILRKILALLGTCQKLAGGEGGWKQREGHDFLRLRKWRGHKKWAVKRGRVMQIYVRDHVEVHPQKKKEVLYLLKKRKEQRNIMDINCEVVLQEFNKHLLFIYNNAIQSYCNYE